jgi:hypothetical protein
LIPIRRLRLPSRTPRTKIRIAIVLILRLYLILGERKIHFD